MSALHHRNRTWLRVPNKDEKRNDADQREDPVIVRQSASQPAKFGYIAYRLARNSELSSAASALIGFQSLEAFRSRSHPGAEAVRFRMPIPLWLYPYPPARARASRLAAPPLRRRGGPA